MYVAMTTVALLSALPRGRVPVAQLRCSEGGKRLKQSFEGKRYRAYDDAQPNLYLTDYQQLKGTLTIGIGHTGPDVYVGMELNDDQIDELFREDVREAEEYVRRYVKVPMSQLEFDAFVDVFFNCGPGKKGVRDGPIVLESGAQSRTLRLLNAGDYDGFKYELANWFSTPPFEDGLTKRCVARHLLSEGLPWDMAVANMSSDLKRASIARQPGALKNLLDHCRDIAIGECAAEIRPVAPLPPQEPAQSYIQPDDFMVTPPIVQPAVAASVAKPQAGKKPPSEFTYSFEQVGLDPSLGVKSIDDSDRATGWWHQKLATSLFSFAKASGFLTATSGGTLFAFAEYIVNDPALYQASINALQFVVIPAGTAAALWAWGWGHKIFGTRKRAAGQAAGSQAIAG